MKLKNPSNVKQVVIGVTLWSIAIASSTIGVIRAFQPRETIVFAAYNRPVTEMILRLQADSYARENEELNIQVASLDAQVKDMTEKLAMLKTVDLTEDELDLVCRVVAAEARGESYKGQLGVAQVIRDRLLSGYYGTTVSEVVSMPNQFAYPWDGDLDLYPTVAQAVNEIFNGKDVFDGAALYFFNPSTSNQGAVETIREGSAYFGVIGRHEFRGLE